MRYRHQVRTPECTFDLEVPFEHLFNLFKKNSISLTPWKRFKVVNSYSGPYRAKYFRAQQVYNKYGLQQKHSHATLFVKDDKYSGEPEKACRAIQYRHPVFMLEQGRFTKPIEKWFYSLQDEYDTTIVGKSDPFTIAKTLIDKSSVFVRPTYLLLDASKFDSCVDAKWLRLCMRFYLLLFPKRYHNTIRYLWTKTFINRGRTTKGLRFKTNGTRLSGDMDTGLGNSIIMWAMLKTFLCNLKIKHSILVNGDDSVVVIEYRDLYKTSDLKLFEEMGFNMKCDVVYDISDVEFCQAKVIETDYGHTMSRNPERVLARTAWTTIKYGRSKARAYVNTLGLCERAASWGVPIASQLATQMINSANTTRTIEMRPWLKEYYGQMKKWWKTGEPKISLETRLNFWSAWGISVDQQLRLENSIKVMFNMQLTHKHLEEYYQYVRS